MQLAQSLDFNMKDFGGLTSVKSRVWKEQYGLVDEMVAGVSAIFAENNIEMLQR